MAKIEKGTSRTREVLRLEKVSRDYPMGDATVRALRGLDLEIKAGDRLSIIGPSGCGKSTLLHILGLLDTPTSGRVVVNGMNVTEMDDDERAGVRARTIGFVFQVFNLVPSLDALENVMLPMIFTDIPEDARHARAEAALQRLGMGDRLRHRPNELSGGQRQRVAIARALINDPDIILADEPTGNLDSKSGAEVLKIFDELSSEGKTVIVVTHDPTIAGLSKKIVHLKDGTIEKIEVRK